MTPADLAETIENHHQRDEMDPDFQHALHQLAARCCDMPSAAPCDQDDCPGTRQEQQ